MKSHFCIYVYEKCKTKHKTKVNNIFFSEYIQGVSKKSVMFGWVHKFKASYNLNFVQCALVD